ncbi:hypothetical protein, partial [Pseudomonas shirazensis]
TTDQAQAGHREQTEQQTLQHARFSRKCGKGPQYTQPLERQLSAISACHNAFMAAPLSLAQPTP